MNCIVVIRLFRFLGLLGEIPSYRVIFLTAKSLARPFSTLIGVLFLLYYVFAQLGCAIFGGMIYYHSPLLFAPGVDLDSHYVHNNMNDMMTAFVTLFELMIVNNWFVIVRTFTLSTQTKFTRVYFIAFYVLGVLVCLNICVAFVLDMFNSQVSVLGDEASTLKDPTKQLMRQHSMLNKFEKEEEEHIRLMTEREREQTERDRDFQDGVIEINDSFKRD